MEPKILLWSVSQAACFCYSFLREQLQEKEERSTPILNGWIEQTFTSGAGRSRKGTPTKEQAGARGFLHTQAQRGNTNVESI
jgi:hypothetical protein